MTSTEEKSSSDESPDPPKPVLPPCMVCGGESSGCHFGLVTCESCKVFYRRSLRKKTDYKCKKDGKCVMQSARKQNCSACRLKKCHDLGMSKDAIRKGRYSVLRKSDYKTMKVNIESEKKERELKTMLYQKRVKDTIDRVNSLHVKYPTITKADIERLPSFEAEKMHYIRIIEDTFGPTTAPSIEELFSCYKSTGIDFFELEERYRNCLKCEESLAEEAVSYARELPEFMELSLHDRTMTLKGTFREWIFISRFPFVNTKDRLLSCPLCGNVIHEKDLDIIKNRMEVQSWLKHCDILQQQNLRQEEIAVLRALVLFDSSQPVDAFHEKPDQIDSIQTHFLNCLLHVLQENRGPENASKVYCNIVRALTISRSVHHMTACLRNHATEYFSSLKWPRLLGEINSLPEHCIEELEEGITELHIAGERNDRGMATL